MKKSVFVVLLVSCIFYKGFCNVDMQQPPNFVQHIDFNTGEDCTTPECQKSPVLILSIDGASVRGLAQLYILQALEAMLRQILGLPNITLTGVFNVYAGTSAGAINTVALLTPDNVPPRVAKDAFLPRGTHLIPRYQLNRPVAQDETGAAVISEEMQKLDVNSPAVIDGLREKGQMDLTAAAELLIGKTFKQTVENTAHKLRVFFGITGARFKHNTLENLLKGITTMAVLDKQKAAEDESRIYYRMADTVKPAVLTSWDARNRELFLFSTFDACQHLNDPPEQARNKEMWFGARTASAGPTYFNPTALIEKVYGQEIRRVLMDAGLIVMSPALLGLVEAMRIYPNRRYVIVSLSGGVMNIPRELETEGVHAAGMNKILKPAIEDAVVGGPKVTERVLSALPNVVYLRVNFEVNNTDFEDASEKNIAHIKQAAFNAIVSEKFKIVVNEVAKAYREQQIRRDVPPYTKCVFPKDALTDKNLSQRRASQNVWSMSVNLSEPPAKKMRTDAQETTDRAHTVQERTYAFGRPVSIHTVPLSPQSTPAAMLGRTHKLRPAAGRFNTVKVTQ